MKAITIHQPWASLIACGAKKIETRGWATSYRGQIAIHAGKRPFDTTSYFDRELFRFADVLGLPDIYSFDQLAYGAVIAIADLVDCVLMDAFNLSPKGKVNGVWLVNGDYMEGNELLFGDFQPGRYAWMLANVRRIEPAPARGRQRLWEWEGDIIA